MGIITITAIREEIWTADFDDELEIKSFLFSNFHRREWAILFCFIMIQRYQTQWLQNVLDIARNLRQLQILHITPLMQH